MSKLLFDEAPLVIQPTLAKAIGLNESIILQQIHYWLTRKTGGKEIDGARWIWNSLSDWQAQFPFWSESTIYRTLQSLEEKKLIKTGCFNQRKGDRTKWFTIAYDLLESVETGGVETASSHNETSSIQDGTTLPESTTETTTELAAPSEIPNPQPVELVTPNVYAAYFSTYVQHLPLSKENDLVEELDKYEGAWQDAAFKRAFEKELETGERWAASRRLAYSIPILREWKTHGGITERRPGKRSPPDNNFTVIKTSDGGFFG